MKSYFRYIRGKNGVGLGAVLVTEFPHGQFKIGVSICNPKDEFSKTEARTVAEKNLEESNIYDFYEMIDGDWYADIVSTIPNRGIRLEAEVFATIVAISEDITMDYARSHYKNII